MNQVFGPFNLSKLIFNRSISSSSSANIWSVPFIGALVGVDRGCSWGVTSAALGKPPGCHWVPASQTPLTSIATNSSSEWRGKTAEQSITRDHDGGALPVARLASPSPPGITCTCTCWGREGGGPGAQPRSGRGCPGDASTWHFLLLLFLYSLVGPEPNGSKSETKRAALLLDKIMFAVQKVDIILLDMDPQLSTFFGQKKENYGIFLPIENSQFLGWYSVLPFCKLVFEELPNSSFEGIRREGEARRGEEGLWASSQYQPCLIHRGESGLDHHDDVEPQLDEDDDCNEKHCGSPQNTSCLSGMTH